MMKRIMILGGSEIQVPIIEKCKKLGHFTIVVDYDPEAPGLTLADVALVISTNDKEAVLNHATEQNIDGILTTSDLPVRVVAHVASKLDLPALSEESAFFTTNKFQMRKKLKESNFNIPEFSIIQNENEIEFLNSFPYVVKPVDSSGSRGVRRINTVEGMRGWLPEALKHSNSQQVIAESFIPGSEFSVESITQSGKTHIIAITEKRLFANDKGYFVENAHIIPATIPNRMREKIEMIVKRAVEVLKIDNTACHTELKVNNNEVTIIEIGARLGGDFIGSKLVELSTGVDMLQNVINLAIGLPISVKSSRSYYAGIQFLTPLNYLKAKSYVEDNKQSIYSFHFKPFKNIEIKNSFNRLGHIIIVSKTKDKLDRVLNFINSE